MDCNRPVAAPSRTAARSYWCRDAAIQASASTEKVVPIRSLRRSRRLCCCSPVARSRSPRRQAAAPSAHSEYAEYARRM